ncbi:MAG: hypothetical protein ACPGLY_04890 [Rubripirellula sp.]
MPTEVNPLSKAELIQSFLAAHNIRWGELVAGMLIVVCSIGLVISLWSPLVAKHRVVPSLIFLAANAAIFAAGLYTLSRWRLRHTSRAVLVIATLLVPLSVLAGLAAARASGEAVQLTEPVTLAAIVIGGVVYLTLLRLSGAALVHRKYALPNILAVAGPVAVLPIVPAAVRTFNSNAGWLLGFGSLLVAIACLWMIRARREQMTFGYAGSRARLLVIGFGGFSLSIAVGYTAFMARTFGLDGYLTVALASIPGVVALAGLSRSLMKGARDSTQSMIGGTLYAVLIGLAWVTIPAANHSPGWLWAWASILSVSLLLLGWLANQPRQIALATIPLGMAVVMTSTIWLGDLEWEQISFWRRIIGGEPMVAMGIVSIAVGLMAVVSRRAELRQPMEIAALGWTLLLLINTSILTVAPHSMLGEVKAWIVTLILAVTVGVNFFYSLRWKICDYGTLVAAIFACSSVFRPIGVGQEFAGPNVSMMTLFAIAITLAVLSELARPLAAWRRTPLARVIESCQIWWSVSAVSILLAALIACFTATDDWLRSTIYLALASVVLAWVWTMSRNLFFLRLAQIASIAMAIAIGFGQFEELLFSSDAWRRCEAPWAWAILAGSVAGGWIVARAAVSVLIRSDHRLKKRLGSFTKSNATPILMIDGSLIGIQTFLVGLSSAWVLASLFAQTAGSEVIQYGASTWLPMGSLFLGILVVWFARRQETDLLLGDCTLSIVGISSLIWVSSAFAAVVTTDTSGRVIIATTLSAVGGFSIPAFLGKTGLSLARPATQLAPMISIIIVAVASIVLLYFDWYTPISKGGLADFTSTTAVSAWWLTAAVGLLWSAKQTEQKTGLIGSALLTPLAITILVPAIAQTSGSTWIQIAGLGSVGWLLAVRFWLGRDKRMDPHPGIIGSSTFVLIVGVGSAVLVTLGSLFDLPQLVKLSGIPCFLISLLALGMWLFDDSPLELPQPLVVRPTWPVMVTCMSGQVTWLAVIAGWTSDIQVSELTAAVILLGGGMSLLQYFRSKSTTDFVHITAVNLTLFITCIVIGNASDLFPWLSLLGMTMTGLCLPIASSNQGTTESVLRTCRILGWVIIGAGIGMILSRIATNASEEMQWTISVAWTAAWVITWRLSHADRHQDNVDRRRQAVLALPDMEFAGLLFAGLLMETAWATLIGKHRMTSSAWMDPLLWTRVIIYLGVGFSGFARGRRISTWTMLLGSIMTAISLIAAHVAISFGVSDTQRWVPVLLAAGFAVSLVAHWIIPLSALIAKFSGGTLKDQLTHIAQSTWQLAALVAGLGIASTFAMIVMLAPGIDARMSTLSVVLAAWAIAVTADLSDSNRLRHTAISLGLIALGLLASVSDSRAVHPILTTSMQWLVATVLALPTLVFLLPKLMGTSMAARWRGPLANGAKATGIASLASLACMITREVMLRDHGRIEGIAPPLIIGVAVTLAALSLLAAIIAIISGPSSAWRERLTLTDTERRILIAAAQGFASMTWLHIFLCNQEWGFLGLKDYWPYIVLTLAFTSVGAVEWSRRRQDEVMSTTLSYTSLYLPLIPVLGFWLSGSLAKLEWAFPGGVVRYDVFLLLGAAYYLFISALWKQLMPRVTAILLANAAWWIVLAQRPGWDFLTHPQIWLIPPAACVLVMVHLYRDQLAPSVRAPIRYGATLLIYVSSTADMLVQEIGSHLSGPIILILLSLFGMLMGVVLRIRPFLYLGAMFVFLGVTSMVWHAHQALEAVWPWWVFGITTGVCLLAGLMAIEKNKSKLRRYAENVTAWNG